MAKLYVPVEIQRMIISFLPLKEMVPVSIVSLAWREMVIAEGTSALHRNFAKFLEHLSAAIASKLPDVAPKKLLLLQALLLQPCPAKTEYDSFDYPTTLSLFRLLNWQKRQVRIALNQKFQPHELTDKLHPAVAWEEGWKFFLSRMAADLIIREGTGNSGDAGLLKALDLSLSVDVIGKAKECLPKMQNNWEGYQRLCVYYAKHRQYGLALDIVRSVLRRQEKDLVEESFFKPLRAEIEAHQDLAFLRVLHKETELPWRHLHSLRVSICRVSLQLDHPEAARAMVKLIMKGHQEYQYVQFVRDCEDAYMKWCVKKKDWKKALAGISGLNSVASSRIKTLIEESCNQTDLPPCYFRELLQQPDLVVASYKARLGYALLESLMRTDQIDEALETLPQLPQDPRRQDTFCNIIEQPTKKGLVQKAADLVPQVSHFQSRKTFWNKIEPHISLM